MENRFERGIAEKEEYEIYNWLGQYINHLEGLVIPLGVNIYLLTTKPFGFYIELAWLIGNATFLRGSAGKFNRGRIR